MSTLQCGGKWDNNYLIYSYEILRVMLWRKKLVIALIPLKSFTKNILLFQHNLPTLLFLKRVYLSQLWHLQVSLIKNETECCFNSTIQMLYCNVIFWRLILNIDSDNTMSCLDINDDQVSSCYQNILIVKEL